jgi:hypothetical protein
VAGACIETLLGLREPRYIFVFAPGAWVWFAWLVCRFAEWLGGAPRWQKIAVGIALAGLVALFVPSERKARAQTSTASSGIRDLAAHAIALQHTGATLFLTAPDYLAPTFGYYVSRVSGAQIHGFVRWHDPQIFVTAGYLRDWTDPTAVQVSERRITRMMQSRDRRLCLIRDAILINRARVPYTRANALFAWLREHYRLVSSTEYPGREEHVIVETFVPFHTDPRR